MALMLLMNSHSAGRRSGHKSQLLRTRVKFLFSKVTFSKSKTTYSGFNLEQCKTNAVAGFATMKRADLCEMNDLEHFKSSESIHYERSYRGIVPLRPAGVQA